MENYPSSEFQYKHDIDTSDPLAVKYWTGKWNISPQQLVGAIRATGSNSIVMIKEYIESRRNRVRRPRFIHQL